MYRLTAIFITAASLCAQFTSGTDYSVKKDAQISTAETSVFLQTGETEWKTTYGTGIKYSARSERTEYGLGFFGSNPSGDFVIDYRLGYKNYSIKSSASDSLETASVIKFDPTEINASETEFYAGTEYKKVFGLYADYALYSSDGINENRVGIGASYRLNLSDRSDLKVYFEKGFFSDEDLIGGLSMIANVSPKSLFGAEYILNGENSALGFELTYTDRETGSADSIESAYIGAAVSYEYDFKKAGSSIKARAGTNMASDLTLPEIFIPYYAHSFEYTNRMMKDKLSLSVGWEYELYDSYLTRIPGSGEFIPAGLTAADELSESAGLSRIFLKLTFRY